MDVSVSCRVDASPFHRDHVIARQRDLRVTTGTKQDRLLDGQGGVDVMHVGLYVVIACALWKLSVMCKLFV
jgi:hypothetical protein